MTVSSQVQYLSLIQSPSGGTQAQWEAIPAVVPSGLVVYAIDTTVVKIGDGINPYAALPVAATLTTLFGIGPATTTVAGLVQLATLEQVLLGIAEDVALTPATFLGANIIKFTNGSLTITTPPRMVIGAGLSLSTVVSSPTVVQGALAFLVGDFIASGVTGGAVQQIALEEAPTVGNLLLLALPDSGTFNIQLTSIPSGWTNLGNSIYAKVASDGDQTLEIGLNHKGPAFFVELANAPDISQWIYGTGSPTYNGTQAITQSLSVIPGSLVLALFADGVSGNLYENPVTPSSATLLGGLTDPGFGYYNGVNGGFVYALALSDTIKLGITTPDSEPLYYSIIIPPDVTLPPSSAQIAASIPVTVSGELIGNASSVIAPVGSTLVDGVLSIPTPPPPVPFTNGVLTMTDPNQINISTGLMLASVVPSPTVVQSCIIPAGGLLGVNFIELPTAPTPGNLLLVYMPNGTNEQVEGIEAGYVGLPGGGWYAKVAGSGDQTCSVTMNHKGPVGFIEINNPPSIASLVSSSGGYGVTSDIASVSGIVSTVGALVLIGFEDDGSGHANAYSTPSSGVTLLGNASDPNPGHYNTSNGAVTSALATSTSFEESLSVSASGGGNYFSVVIPPNPENPDASAQLTTAIPVTFNGTFLGNANSINVVSGEQQGVTVVDGLLTVTLSASALNFKGAYDTTGDTTYVVNDVVSFSGATYICGTSTTQSPTDNPSAWTAI